MPTPQAPITSGFGAASTAAEVIAGRDLHGKIAIVTGGYAGLGLETTRALLSAGAKVIVPVRDPAKAVTVLAGLPDAQVDEMDLMNPASIDGFANRFHASGQALDILINNAGIMANPLTRDARGYESQFATNHLGHFQLTARLFPALRLSGNARVVSLSSRGHRRAGVDLEDPNFERRDYDRWVAYGQSKSANVLFAVALDALGQAHGVRAFAVHPGGILTNLAQYMSQDELRAAGAFDDDGKPRLDPANDMKTAEQGAATTIWCATDPRLDGMGGVYCANCNIEVTVPDGSDALYGVRPWATDPEKARKLWALSERLTGVTFDGA